MVSFVQGAYILSALLFILALAGLSKHETARRGEFATGVLYIEPDKDDFIDMLNLVDTPLAFLGVEHTRPPKAVLDEIMESLR